MTAGGVVVPNPAGRLRPTPVVAVDGVDVAGAFTATARTPTPAVPLVIDDLEVIWGRTEAFDQPDLATARVAVLDPSLSWATSRDLIGRLLTVRYTVLVGILGQTQTVTFFRGRITSARVTPVVVDGRDMARVDLTAASILTDLGNTTAPAYPAQTLAQRAAAVAASAAGTLPGGVTVRTSWGSAQVAAADPLSAGTLLDKLFALYTSCGPDKAAYDPNTGTVAPVARRVAFDRAGGAELARVTSGTGQRVGRGVYARSIAAPAADGQPAGAALYLDGQAVEYVASIDKDMSARTTRVGVTYPDATAGSTTSTVAVAGADEVAVGVRSVTFASILSSSSAAATARNDVADQAAHEAAGWRIGELTYRPDLLGGFEAVEQFRDLVLAGVERPSWFFLARSWFPRYGIRPVFALVGGSIGYTAGEWALGLRLQPLYTSGLQHSITWDEIDDGTTANRVVWSDTPTANGLHESLTWDDLKFVGRGLGMTTTPAEQGWDYLT